METTSNYIISAAADAPVSIDTGASAATVLTRTYGTTTSTIPCLLQSYHPKTEDITLSLLFGFSLHNEYALQWAEGKWPRHATVAPNVTHTLNCARWFLTGPHTNAKCAIFWANFFRSIPRTVLLCCRWFTCNSCCMLFMDFKISQLHFILIFIIWYYVFSICQHK